MVSKNDRRETSSARVISSLAPAISACRSVPAKPTPACSMALREGPHPAVATPSASREEGRAAPSASTSSAGIQR
jgi:hypothetical protein